MTIGVRQLMGTLRAARHGRSVEAETHLILTAAATEEEGPRTDLFNALTERFAQLGGVDMDVPARSTPPTCDPHTPVRLGVRFGGPAVSECEIRPTVAGDPLPVRMARPRWR